MSANGRDPDPNPDEPVFTTLAVGEEGPSDPGPDLVFMPHPGVRPWGPPGWPPASGDGGGTSPDPDEPVFTTLAIGEEGAPDPDSGTVVPPYDPVGGGGLPTTLATGEEGDSDPVFTTFAIGEEGDGGSPPEAGTVTPGSAGTPWEGTATTLAIGEEGDAGFGGWDA